MSHTPNCLENTITLSRTKSRRSVPACSQESGSHQHVISTILDQEALRLVQKLVPFKFEAGSARVCLVHASANQHQSEKVDETQMLSGLHLDFARFDQR